MEYTLIIIFIASFLASVVTLITAFGLNVMLMPILAFCMPIEEAIAFTAITFCFHNLTRVILNFKSINWKIVARFTPISLVGVIFGALILSQVGSASPKNLEITMGILLIIIAFLEWSQILKKIKFNQKYFIIIGGFITGLIGGFSGQQGPFRVATLLNLNLEYKEYLATSAITGLIIDSIRSIIYIFIILNVRVLNNPILFVAIIGSLTGFFMFYKKLSNVKMAKVRIITLFFIIASALELIFM
ncbi:TSUP family transporter [Rickettsiales bacterium LUAb2]